MILNLVIGDWGGDGHNIRENYNIDSNLSVEDFWTAYKKGTQILGFDFIQEIAVEYDDNSISEEYQEILKEKLPTKIKICESIYSKDYITVVLDIVKLGNSIFKYKIIDGQEVNIGGYGLMSC